MSGRKPYYHSNLDRDSKLTMELNLRQVAEQLMLLPYGVHRLLSHLVDVRLERFGTLVARQEASGDLQTANLMRHEGDRLALGIAALLESGLY